MVEKRGSAALYVSTIGVLSALMAVLAMASIVVPPPLGSIDASSVLIFVAAILYGPEIGMIITCIGQIVGKGILISSAGLPAVFIPGIVAVRGPEALVVGYIARSGLPNRYREPIAMIIGVIWETIGFIIADYYLFGLAAAIMVSWTIIDLVWVPMGVASLYYVRMTFKTEYLDEDLGLTEVGARRGFLITGVIFIFVCWVLIILAGVMGWAMLPLFPTP